jgi:signal transduction histidine kinase
VDPHRVALDVVDDGVGISDSAIETAMRAGHLGVSSMRRRAAAIGARLEIGANPGGGTRVRLRWPA